MNVLLVLLLFPVVVMHGCGADSLHPASATFSQATTIFERVMAIFPFTITFTITFSITFYHYRCLLL